MKVLVGTASWSDKSLVASKKFYPREANTPEARLRFYATQFPLVEVDTSYYAIPLAATAQAWVDRTPAHFTLNMKAFRLFTGHATAPNVLPPDLRAELPKFDKATFYYRDVPPVLRDALWQRFKDALEPLRASGKLGMVHFQFAPWLLRNRAGHAHVAHCVEQMQDYTVSVEFRNRTWFDDAHLGQTLAFERELDVVHTVIDAPQGFSSSVPPVWESTHMQYSLVRLHGRNHETWNIKGASVASERFNYDYPDVELADIAARVERLAPETFTTHVIMNNNMEDQGQRNAATLTRILEARRRARVPHLVATPPQPVGAEHPESEEAVAASEWVF
ncbi:DUF72 domain-containing protein [Piscinibacter koreensis]|uniref:DUF72 domain-containing protein n=1 Tax=Piscinibacter koreensis TaxID=2742824 RepID=A0A7Y6TY86_9BURK|nr:DUF72 domain-containing protein [Schlegelella koreensis]NUZ07836.1 DUF72 domain-containing protein [Schlegelella koreensis]